MTPYNTNKRVVDRWSHVLDQLDGTVIRLESGDPHKLAYRLREAIAAAQVHDVEPYASLDYVFKPRTGVLIAEPATELYKGTEDSVVRIPGPLNHFDVVQRATDTKADALAFPDFAGDVDMVRKWAENTGFEVTEEPLTLTRKKE